MNFKAIAYYLSLFCFPISFLSFINILYSSYFDYFLNVDSYSTTLIFSLMTGFFLLFVGKSANKRLDFIERILLIVFSYFLISFFISIPYYLSIYQIPLINALFESFSGVTTTGFSIFSNIKYLDPTLILWRSSSQWIGGFYFLIFLVLIFSNKQYNYKLNYLTYGSDGNVSSEKNIIGVSLKIFLIYLTITIFMFMLLSFSGVRLYNALNLSMTLVSTGGFLPTNELSQIVTDNSQKFVIIICFLISILNIFLLTNILNKRNIINNHGEDFFIFLLFLIFSFILMITVKELNIADILLSVLSGLSSSGITVVKVPDNITLYFLLITMVGGSLISNTSGIKLIRIYILIKTSSAEILRLVRPNNVINQNILYTDKKIDNENIKLSFLIFISFFISLFFLSGVLIFDNLNFEHSFKLSVLTLTNTTTSELFGLTNINFANLLTSSKISLIIFMIVGKIELISFLLIIKKYFYRN